MSNILWNIPSSVQFAQYNRDDTLDNDLRRIGAILTAAGKERRLKEQQEEERAIQEKRYQDALDLQRQMLANSRIDKNNNLDLLRKMYGLDNDLAPMPGFNGQFGYIFPVRK